MNKLLVIHNLKCKYIMTWSLGLVTEIVRNVINYFCIIYKLSNWINIIYIIYILTPTFFLPFNHAVTKIVFGPTSEFVVIIILII